MNQTERMKELVELLNKAGRAYYQEDREIISNYEYDKLYDELEALEEETGITLAGSPTVSVGYEAVNALPKETHETPMLSLDKTKEIEVLKILRKYIRMRILLMKLKCQLVRGRILCFRMEQRFH